MERKKTMETVIIGLVWLLTLGGAFFGGQAVKQKEIERLPPKIVNERTEITTHQYMDVQTKQMQISETSSGSVSMVIVSPQTNIRIEFAGPWAKTNYEYRYESNTNTIKSNRSVSHTNW